MQANTLFSSNEIFPKKKKKGEREEMEPRGEGVYNAVTVVKKRDKEFS